MLIAFNAMEYVHKFLLMADGVLYSLVNNLYQVFLILAKFKIFSEGDIAPFVRRMYSIIGVVMLFLLAYDLLKNIVNPAGKGKDTTAKTVGSVVKAIVLLAIVPSLFDLAYDVQIAVLNYNTIGKIIIGPDGLQTGSKAKTPSEVIDEGGITMALGVIKAFIVPNNGSAEKTNLTDYNNMTLEDLWQRIQEDRSFHHLRYLAPSTSADSPVIEYQILACGAAAIYVIYLLISYCIALGLRVIKMAAYEIMAPIPIISSIIPGKQDMLNKWIKVTLTTYAEVFLRVAILYLAVYIISMLSVAFDNGTMFAGVGGFAKTLVKAILFMGVIAFAKSAPDLISEITGISSKNMSTGLKEQLKNGGLFTAGAMAGGAVTGGVRNLVGGISRGSKDRKAYREAKKIENPEARAKAMETAKRRIKDNKSGLARGIAQGLASGVGGAVSGGIHSYNKDAGSWKEMSAAAHKGAETAGKNASRRATYKSTHGGRLLGWDPGKEARLSSAEFDVNGESIMISKDTYDSLTSEQKSKLERINNKKYSYISDESGGGKYTEAADGDQIVIKKTDAANALLESVSPGLSTNTVNLDAGEDGTRGHMTGALWGHAVDARDSFVTWAGADASIEEMRKQSDILQKILTENKALKDGLEAKIQSSAKQGQNMIGKTDISSYTNAYNALEAARAKGDAKSISAAASLEKQERDALVDKLTTNLLSGQGSVGWNAFVADFGPDLAKLGDGLRTAISNSTAYTKELAEAGVKIEWADPKVAIDIKELKTATKDGDKAIGKQVANLNTDLTAAENKRAKREEEKKKE